MVLTAEEYKFLYNMAMKTVDSLPKAPETPAALPSTTAPVAPVSTEIVTSASQVRHYSPKHLCLFASFVTFFNFFICK